MSTVESVEVSIQPEHSEDEDGAQEKSQSHLVVAGSSRSEQDEVGRSERDEIGRSEQDEVGRSEQDEAGRSETA